MWIEGELREKIQISQDFINNVFYDMEAEHDGFFLNSEPSKLPPETISLSTFPIKRGYFTAGEIEINSFICFRFAKQDIYSKKTLNDILVQHTSSFLLDKDNPLFGIPIMSNALFAQIANYDVLYAKQICMTLYAFGYNVIAVDENPEYTYLKPKKAKLVTPMMCGISQALLKSWFEILFETSYGDNPKELYFNAH